MAKVTNAFASYSSATNPEDLAKIIYNIAPSDSPFVNSIGRSKASNRIFEWSSESLAAVDKNNAQEEGFVAVNQAYTPPVRLSNSTQILTKNAVVTRSQQKIGFAGAASPMSHQKAIRSRECKRDMEAIFCGEQPRVDGNDSGVQRKTRGAEHWIQSNVSTGAGYAAPANGTAAMTDGTTRAYTETLLLDALQTAYLNGAEPTLLLMAPTQKRKFSAFQGRTNAETSVKNDTTVQSVDVYISDFGTMKAVPSRFCRARTVLAIDPKMMSVAYLDDWLWDDLAKTGDAEVAMLTVEAGLRVNTELAHAKIADLN